MAKKDATEHPPSTTIRIRPVTLLDLAEPKEEQGARNPFASSPVQCPVCRQDLSDLAIVHREDHVASCLSARQADTFLCPFCEKNITKYSLPRRELHITRCIEQAEQQQAAAAKLGAKPPSNSKASWFGERYSCVICQANLDAESVHARANHLKACARKNRLSARDLGPQSSEADSNRSTVADIPELFQAQRQRGSKTSRKEEEERKDSQRGEEEEEAILPPPPLAKRRRREAPPLLSDDPDHPPPAHPSRSLPPSSADQLDLSLLAPQTEEDEDLQLALAISLSAKKPAQKEREKFPVVVEPDSPLPPPLPPSRFSRPSNSSMAVPYQPPPSFDAPLPPPSSQAQKSQALWQVQKGTSAFVYSSQMPLPSTPSFAAMDALIQQLSSEEDEEAEGSELGFIDYKREKEEKILSRPSSASSGGGGGIINASSLLSSQDITPPTTRPNSASSLPPSHLPPHPSSSLTPHRAEINREQQRELIDLLSSEKKPPSVFLDLDPSSPNTPSRLPSLPPPHPALSRLPASSSSNPPNPPSSKAPLHLPPPTFSLASPPSPPRDLSQPSHPPAAPSSPPKPSHHSHKPPSLPPPEHLLSQSSPSDLPAFSALLYGSPEERLKSVYRSQRDRLEKEFQRRLEELHKEKETALRDLDNALNQRQEELKSSSSLRTAFTNIPSFSWDDWERLAARAPPLPSHLPPPRSSSTAVSSLPPPSKPPSRSLPTGSLRKQFAEEEEDLMELEHRDPLLGEEGMDLEVQAPPPPQEKEKEKEATKKRVAPKKKKENPNHHPPPAAPPAQAAPSQSQTTVGDVADRVEAIMDRLKAASEAELKAEVAKFGLRAASRSSMINELARIHCATAQATTAGRAAPSKQKKAPKVTAKEMTVEELQLRITSIIKRPENAAFYQQILQYDPIDVAALQEILKAAGLRVNRVLLGQYLTSSGVAFSKMKTMNSLVDDRL